VNIATPAPLMAVAGLPNEPAQETTLGPNPLPSVDLTSIDCVDEGTGTTASNVPGTRTASITLGPGGSATCTFVNVQGQITNIKDTRPGRSAARRPGALGPTYGCSDDGRIRQESAHRWAAG
jgi:hypothetical protein